MRQTPLVPQAPSDRAARVELRSAPLTRHVGVVAPDATVSSTAQTVIPAQARPAFAPPSLAPLRETTLAHHAALQRQAQPSTIVQVTIDRIDVRAAAEVPAQRPSPRARAAPSVSLNDYLRQRAPGGRG
jgi:hypothetical protein